MVQWLRHCFILRDCSGFGTRLWGNNGAEESPAINLWADILKPNFQKAAGHTVSWLLICLVARQTLFHPVSFFFFSLTGCEWLLDSPVLTGDIVDVSKPLTISTRLPAPLKDSAGSPCLTLSVWLYYCKETEHTCMMNAASFTQPLYINAKPGEDEVTVALAHAF